MRNFKKIITCFLISFLFNTNIFSKNLERPKIALVLSGGGAKGFAEIPLIELIEDLGIPIDMVLGTSMGSLIGGLYSSGYSAKEIRNILTHLDYLEMFNSSPTSPEHLIPQAFNTTRDNFFTFPFSFESINKLPGLGGAPGLIGEQNILNNLAYYFKKIQHITDFDKLPIPFRAIATNVNDGKEYIFKEGSIVNAIRGSISIPAVFTPSATDDKQYVLDGGLINNLPIQVAIDMGADIIIAMDVASITNTDPSSIKNMTDTATYIFNFIISQNAVQQHKLAHLLLCPNLKDYSTFDFLKVNEIIREGEICIEENKEKIQNFIKMLENKGVKLNPLQADRQSYYNSLEDPVINYVKIKNNSVLSSRALPSEKYFSYFINKKIDEKNKEILLYTLDTLKEKYYLSSLTYQINYDNEKKVHFLEIAANYYEKDLNQIFLGGEIYSSINNNTGTIKYKPIIDLAGGIKITKPFDSILQLNIGDINQFNFSLYPQLLNNSKFFLDLKLGGGIKYGSLEPESSIYNSKNSISEDKGFYFDAGLRLNYYEQFSLSTGFNYSLDSINSTSAIHNFYNYYADIIYSNLTNYFTNPFGIQAQALFKMGDNFSYDSKLNIALKLSFEQRFSIYIDNTFIGYNIDFNYNRYPPYLNIGYNEFGGLQGMSGYSKGFFKRDFAIAGLFFQQKITEISGLPLYFQINGKIGLSDKNNPFINKEINSDFFYGINSLDDIELGGGVYFILNTILGNLIIGGSVNTSGMWNISIGVK